MRSFRSRLSRLIRRAGALIENSYGLIKQKEPVALHFDTPCARHHASLVVMVPVSPKTDGRFVRSTIELVKRAAAPFRECRLIFDSSGTPPPRNKSHPYRQPALAKIRQDMVERYLGDADWVAWVDVDVVDYPADLFEQLVLRADGGIAAPVVLMEGEFDAAAMNSDGFAPGRFYDVAGFVEGLRWARFDEPWFDQSGPTYSLDSVGTCYMACAEIYRKGAHYLPDSYSLEFIKRGLSWTSDTVRANQGGPANCFTEHFSVCQWAKEHGLPVRAFDLVALHTRV